MARADPPLLRANQPPRLRPHVMIFPVLGRQPAGPGAGIQANGVQAMPNDGKPEHQLPYTSYGLQVYKSHHALEGADAVLPKFYDDPRDKCEPMGFPRANFYNLRETQILQNEFKVVILYQYATTWRVVWTDGRPLPNHRGRRERRQ